jgi:hypothetical protein
MLEKLIWATALLLDVAGIVLGLALARHFLVWSVLVVVTFVALVIALTLAIHSGPAVRFRRQHWMATTLPVAVPLITFGGSLDAGTISSLEWLAIIIGAVIGVVNWAALTVIAAKAGARLS